MFKNTKNQLCFLEMLVLGSTPPKYVPSVFIGIFGHSGHFVFFTGIATFPASPKTGYTVIRSGTIFKMTKKHILSPRAQFPFYELDCSR